MELSQIVEDFPNYEVTNYGRVINLVTGKELAHSRTTSAGGDLSVGFFKGGRQHRLSVKCLVARAFVQGESEVYNTPILLDGNRRHLHADNILWRPRWFACTYVRQFRNIPDWAYSGPVVDVNDGLQYDTIYDAAISNGLLLNDVLWSIFDDRECFPTRQIFKYI